jgi:glyoxylase-like metal-dependent hydrolase (beta-lactamase superfamily II)
MGEGQSIFQLKGVNGLFVIKLINFPISSNCYVIRKEGTKVCILVDPSQEGIDVLANYLLLENLRPGYILITHEHFDHLSSVESLRREYDCKLVATAACSDNITNPKKNLSLFYDQNGFACSPADIIIDDNNDELKWENTQIKFYVTPGHSAGGMCFSISNNLFTGDTFLRDHKTVVKLPGGNKNVLQQSISMLREIFGKNVMIFPGHGEPFIPTEWASIVNE